MKNSSRFYVTLPSNSSMKHYPDNTVARYTTKLSNPTELEGEWEVGLAEISVPSAVQNTISGQCYYTMRVGDKRTVTLHIPPGNYKRVHTLLSRMHQVDQVQVDTLGIPGGRDHAIVWFDYNANEKVEIIFRDGDGTIDLNYIVVTFSQDLALMLGFEPDRKYQYWGNRIIARNKPTMIAGDVHSMYVYCNLVERRRRRH